MQCQVRAELVKDKNTFSLLINQIQVSFTILIIWWSPDSVTLRKKFLFSFSLANVLFAKCPAYFQTPESIYVILCCL